ncbi:uncharacterized protein LOC109709664 [Ananas comosus]|uniref:Uncharacterized protein LOC109709664 n=1 Tax=Ananas comosus TaxID=4615 RepID=A0A6P5EUW9_ANACO|nr:uncharacterized protein LOC109709664 [Ananas comosus]
MEDVADERERLTSLTNLNPEEEEEEEEGQKREKSPGGEREEGVDTATRGKEEGIIDHIISNLSINIPSLSPHGLEEKKEEVKESMEETHQKEDEEPNNGGGDGLIDHIVSKLDATIAISPSGKKIKGGEESSSGGVINHLLSTLPASLPISDEQAPGADEASLLISIVED